MFFFDVFLPALFVDINATAGALKDMSARFFFTDRAVQRRPPNFSLLNFSDGLSRDGSDSGISYLTKLSHLVLGFYLPPFWFRLSPLVARLHQACHLCGGRSHKNRSL
jgi:hypothetical protein